jgi:DNA repair exonuclease SbcCD ATPase subunit
MESIRHIFHPNEAPRVVSYTYLELMETEINEILRIFDAPFYVTPDDSLGFMATFHADGKTIPDRRLSVGERIVLSIAFRIVVNATFASTLGLLIMDEPAAGLDEHNIGCLPRALECLRTLSEERGLQVLFVSHEQQLRQYFDNVIEIVT